MDKSFPAAILEVIGENAYGLAGILTVASLNICEDNREKFIYLLPRTDEELKVEYNAPVISEDGSGIENIAAIFEGDYKRIFRYILSMVRDLPTAEDLTQETFLRAYKSRASLRADAAQTAWLYKIATHVCLDRLRQYARRAPLESEADLEQVEVPEPNIPSLQQVIERDEMSVCVQRYLKRLSDSYRAVILLHDMHGLAAPEIAQLLGESLSTVKIRLHRARLKLRAALEAGCAFSYDESNVLTCESKH